MLSPGLVLNNINVESFNAVIEGSTYFSNLREKPLVIDLATKPVVVVLVIVSATLSVVIRPLAETTPAIKL